MKGPAILSANTENAHYDRSATPASDEQAFVGRRQQDAANISRTITDLEKLLREALVMAHQAADKDDDSQALVDRRAASRSGVSSEAGSSLSGGRDEEEHYTSVPLNLVDNDVTLVELNSGTDSNGANKRAQNAISQRTSTNKAPMAPPIDGETFAKTQLGDGPFITVQPPTTTIRDNNIEPFSSRDWAILKRQPTRKIIEAEKGPSLQRQATKRFLEAEQGPSLQRQPTKRLPEPQQGSTLLRRPTTLQAPLKQVRTFQARPQKPSTMAFSEDVVPQRINRYVLHYSSIPFNACGRTECSPPNHH